jgi:hypothetical protein
VDDEPHSGFEVELAVMLTELHSYNDIRDTLASYIKSKINTTRQYLKKSEEYQNAIARARGLLQNGDLDGAQRELDRVDEGSSAEIMQEKLQVEI